MQSFQNMFSLTLFTFREKFVGICYQIFEYGIKEHDKRQAEVNQFWECIEEAKNENKQLGIKAIDEFMLMKKKVKPDFL